jgi:putative thioredoxin
LLQGEHKESIAILNKFPASKEFNFAEQIRPLAMVLERLESGKSFVKEDPLDAAFITALRLVKRGNVEAAMDGLLDILRENKHYQEGAARKVMVALLALLGDENPVTRQYRSELASVLF